MRILDLLQEESIVAKLQSKDKIGILGELAAPVSKITKIKKEELVEILMNREKLGSTGIGGGIGIPHGKIKNLESMIIGFGLSKKGVNFDSIDGNLTHIFFLLLTPENSTGLHLKLLGRISRMLKDEPFKHKIIAASNREEILSIIRNEDEEF